MQNEDRLSNRALFGYGLSAAPVIYSYVLILIMYMKYAAVELGVSTAVIGTIFLVAKLWDAVTDPMVGTLSDRTTHKSGRRRPWLLAGAPLLAIFSIMAWAPPAGLEGPGLVAWISVAVLGFYTAYTIFVSAGVDPFLHLATDLQGAFPGIRQPGLRELAQGLGELLSGESVFPQKSFKPRRAHYQRQTAPCGQFESL